MKTYLILPLLFFSFATLATQIYKWVDKNGNVHYSDQPQQNAEQVKVESGTAVSLNKPSGTLEDNSKPKEELIDYNVVIVSPVNEQTIRQNQGTFTVTGNSEPTLQPSHLFALDMDGQTAGAPQSSPRFSLSNIDRGEHKLTMHIVDKSGKSIARSEPVTIFVHRPIIGQAL